MSAHMIASAVLARVEMSSGAQFELVPHNGLKRPHEYEQWVREHAPGTVFNYAGPVEEWALPLDHPLGREPGVYAVEGRMRVQREGKIRQVDTQDFCLLGSPGYAHLARPRPSGPLWLGELPERVLFYSDDRVKMHRCAIKGQKENPTRQVVSVLRAPENGGLLYRVEENDEEYEIRLKSLDSTPSKEGITRQTWEMRGEDLYCMGRGPVFYLYHDLSKFLFKSTQEELRFWAREGVSEMVHGYVELSKVLGQFATGHIDVVCPARYAEKHYSTYRLHKRFAEHREHVRKLVEREYHRSKRFLPVFEAAL